MLMKSSSLKIFAEQEPLEADGNPDELEVLGSEPPEDATDDHPGETQSHGDDSRFWFEAELLAEIAEVSRSRDATANHMEELKEEQKECRAQLKSQENRLFRLTAKLARRMDGSDIPSDAKQPKPVSNEATEGAEPEDQSWRETPTSELVAEVEGLGPKKIETLVDLVPTVGDLEDLRGKASEQHKPFKELLPKGFGQKAVDGIEDALVNHIAKWSNEKNPPIDIEEVDHFKWVSETLDSHRKEFDANKGYQQPREGESDFEMFMDGKECFERGSPASECPCRVNSDNPEISITEEDQKDWLWGWVVGEKLKKN